MKNNFNILICPLEWGLGHAARMIPLAKKLQQLNNNIFIGSGEEHYSLFSNELTGISFIKFTGFSPAYSRFLPQYLALLLKVPLLFYHIIREHQILKRIIEENKIDIVISDNRFGLWNKNVTTVYVTHMPLIPFPKPFRSLEFLGVILHRAVIKRYSQCYIPDLPGKLNFSGRLSHDVKIPDNVKYIGILSRFTESEAILEEDKVKFSHNTVILSGPQPQREILRQKLIAILKKKEPVTVFLEGNPGKTEEILSSDNLLFYNHLPSSEMKAMISGSKNIITRAGYSTVMELISLNCTALLIPTPGQTEQEYLAEYLSEKGWFSSIDQSNLKDEISFSQKNTIWEEDIVRLSNILLTEALRELIEYQRSVVKEGAN